VGRLDTLPPKAQAAFADELTRQATSRPGVVDEDYPRELRNVLRSALVFCASLIPFTADQVLELAQRPRENDLVYEASRGSCFPPRTRVGMCLLQCAAAVSGARGRWCGAVCHRDAVRMWRCIGAEIAPQPRRINLSADEVYVQWAPPNGGRPAASGEAELKVCCVKDELPPAAPLLHTPDRPPLNVFCHAIEAAVTLEIAPALLPRLLGGGTGADESIPWPLPLATGVYMYHSRDGEGEAVRGFVELAGTAITRHNGDGPYTLVLLTRRAWCLSMQPEAAQYGLNAGWWNRPLDNRARLLLALGRAQTRYASTDAQTAADMLAKVVEGVAPSEYSIHAKNARLTLHNNASIDEARSAFKHAVVNGLALNISTLAMYGVEQHTSLHMPLSAEVECFATFAAPAGKDLGFFPLFWVDSVPPGSRYTHLVNGMYFTSVGGNTIFDSVDEATADTEEVPNVRFVKDTIPGRYVYGFADDDSVPVLRVVAVSDLVLHKSTGRCRLLTYYGDEYEEVRERMGYKAKRFTAEQLRVACEPIDSAWLRAAWIPYKLSKLVALHRKGGPM